MSRISFQIGRTGLAMNCSIGCLPNVGGSIGVPIKQSPASRAPNESMDCHHVAHPGTRIASGEKCVDFRATGTASLACPVLSDEKHLHTFPSWN